MINFIDNLTQDQIEALESQFRDSILEEARNCVIEVEENIRLSADIADWRQ